jgi:hypothetical protein
VDILNVSLDDYVHWSHRIVDALRWTARFMHGEHIFRAEDLPYRTQLVPLSAIRAVLGASVETYANRPKIRRWYWSGVLGELYGGSTETRFARDLEQVVGWVRGGGPEPGTVIEANFHEQRLLTLRTRNSAAYKGVYALLLGDSLDWRYQKHIEHSSYFRDAIDIHHIFPKAWCVKEGIDANRRESIVNKTARTRIPTEGSEASRPLGTWPRWKGARPAIRAHRRTCLTAP